MSKLISFKELENKYIGVIGTPERDKYEKKLRKESLKELAKQAQKLKLGYEKD